VICVLTDLLAEMFRKMHKDPPLVFMACFALMMGYVFGFVVSLDHLLMGGGGTFCRTTFPDFSLTRFTLPAISFSTLFVRPC